MNGNKKVICAGCNQKYLSEVTEFYRNKRWCGNSPCKDIIDYKVKHANYKKAKRKMEKGTFRHGVEFNLRESIKTRDGFTCRYCLVNDSSKPFQVHHIVPVANGGDDDKSNLILLCYECHTDIHRKGWENYTKQFLDYTAKVLV